MKKLCFTISSLSLFLAWGLPHCKKTNCNGWLSLRGGDCFCPFRWQRGTFCCRERRYNSVRAAKRIPCFRFPRVSKADITSPVASHSCGEVIVTIYEKVVIADILELSYIYLRCYLNRLKSLKLWGGPWSYILYNSSMGVLYLARR